jgi:hypothetical protein
MTQGGSRALQGRDQRKSYANIDLSHCGLFSSRQNRAVTLPRDFFSLGICLRTNQPDDLGAPTHGDPVPVCSGRVMPAVVERSARIHGSWVRSELTPSLKPEHPGCKKTNLKSEVVQTLAARTERSELHSDRVRVQ